MISGKTNGSTEPHNRSGISLFLFSSPLGKTLVRIALSIAVLGFIINITKFILRGHRDVEIFFFAARQLVAGGELYTVEAPTGGFYIYLPLFAFLLIPLAFLPVWAATFIWTTLNVVCVWAIVVSLFRVITGRPFKEIEFKDQLVIFALALLPSSDFLISNMRNGQANVVVLAMSVGAIVLSRSKQQSLSGVVIGLAAVIKIFSLPLAVWMFLQRKSVAITGVLSGIAGGLLLPAVLIGWRINEKYISHWATQILTRRDIRDHFVPFEFNTSYEAILLKLFSGVPAFTYDNAQYAVSVFSIDERVIRFAGILLILITLSLLVLYWQRFRNGHRIASEVGGPILALLVAPLITPLTEKYHLVFLLPGYVYLVVLYRYFAISDRIFVALGLLSFALGTLTVKSIWGDYFSKLWFSHGCLIFCVLFLIASVFRAARLLETGPVMTNGSNLASTGPYDKMEVVSTEI